MITNTHETAERAPTASVSFQRPRRSNGVTDPANPIAAADAARLAARSAHDWLRSLGLGAAT